MTEKWQKKNENREEIVACVWVIVEFRVCEARNKTGDEEEK